MKDDTPALGHFQIVVPPFLRPQTELVSWTARCHQESALATASAASALPGADASENSHSAEVIQKLFRRYGVSPEKIQTRAFECPDIQSFDGWPENKIYRFSKNQFEGVSIRDRAEFFNQRAQSVFSEFYPSGEALPDHLIHVTCTGYVSPSAAQLLAAGHPETAVTHAYHMGCYASLPAVRMAEAFVRAKSTQPGPKTFTTDIVHTEMCGLHMNAADHTPEQIVVQTLFADGHIKYSVKPSREFDHGFRILKIHEEIVANSAEDMSWIPSPWGMQMTLSRQVPDKIALALRPFLQALVHEKGQGQSQDQSLAEILKSAIFAVHPGGPKIIESVRQTLELSLEQTLASEKVLRERGNMSSATLPHVWDEILQSKPKAGTKVVSLAFGPGLTIFGAVFECL